MQQKLDAKVQQQATRIVTSIVGGTESGVSLDAHQSKAFSNIKEALGNIQSYGKVYIAHVKDMSNTWEKDEVEQQTVQLIKYIIGQISSFIKTVEQRGIPSQRSGNKFQPLLVVWKSLRESEEKIRRATESHRNNRELMAFYKAVLAATSDVHKILYSIPDDSED